MLVLPGFVIGLLGSLPLPGGQSSSDKLTLRRNCYFVFDNGIAESG
jgi:hypothetical protein